MKNTPPSNMMLEHHTALLAAAAAHSNVPTTPEIIQEALKSVSATIYAIIRLKY